MDVIHVRIDAVNNAGKNILIYIDIIFIARTHRNRPPVREAPAPTAHHVLACLGIVRVLVRAEVEDRIVLFEDVLRVIAVVRVEVYDEHSLVPDCQGVSRADRDVVDDAKPHALVLLGVVSGRPYCAERALDLRTHDVRRRQRAQKGARPFWWREESRVAGKTPRIARQPAPARRADKPP